MKMYTDKDCHPQHLQGKKIAVLGYGSQGQAHALNLRDSGLNVRIGLKKESASVAKAQKENLQVQSVPEVCQWADKIVMLLPDESAGEIYHEEIAPVFSDSKNRSLIFAHGFNIHFQKIKPPDHISVFMIAPKGPGPALRKNYLTGKGLASLVAIAQDPRKNALLQALAYAQAIGCSRLAILETSFKEETECDLFGEQVVLCGGLPKLIKMAFETLVQAGYAPEMAYFECLHEVKLIADLIHQGGLHLMHQSISNTAQYGGLTRGNRIFKDETRQEMEKILHEIQDGSFAAEWLLENKKGRPLMNRLTQEDQTHLLEEIGHNLRKKISNPKP
jgi:ketol-acid reductoisomerase